MIPEYGKNLVNHRLFKSQSCKAFDSRFWSELCSHSVIPNTVGQKSSILLSFRDAVLCPAKSSTTYNNSLDLPADTEPFDWQHKQSEVDLVPTFVRPGKPDSPVDINFDHNQAAFGQLENACSCNIANPGCCDVLHDLVPHICRVVPAERG